MKHKVLVITLTLAYFLLSGCQGSVDKEDGNILFPEITKTVGNGKLSEVVSIRDAKILGNYEDFMIGRIEKIAQFNDDSYVIQSSGVPIVIYNSVEGTFTKIGNIGGGEGEYINPLDFATDDSNVYVLTSDGIKRYGLDGKYLNTIKTGLNADGIHVVDNKIMLFVLGDKHVIHLIDMDGNTLAEELPMNAALRLSRAISFYEYGDYILFHEGHSNDVFAYDRNSKSFRTLKILPEENAMSIEDEANILENGDKLNNQDAIIFDALAASGKQFCVGVMKDKKPFIYFTDDKNCTSISISDIEDDIFSRGTMSFFTKGVISNKNFLAYLYPDILIEHKDEILKSPTCPDVIKDIANRVTDDDNPIIIEYEFK